MAGNQPKRKLVPVKLKRKDGIIQTYYIRGAERARSYPKRAYPTRSPRRARSKPKPQPAAPAPVARPRGKFETWFKAFGTTGNVRDLRDPYIRGLIDEDSDTFAVPEQFYSQQASLFGRVKFSGAQKLDRLIRELNTRLQFAGEETKGFDFRQYYRIWSYRYQVYRILGGERFLEVDIRDSKPKKRGGRR